VLIDASRRRRTVRYRGRNGAVSRIERETPCRRSVLSGTLDLDEIARAKIGDPRGVQRNHRRSGG
jgi:hypothetical protein